VVVFDGSSVSFVIGFDGVFDGSGSSGGDSSLSSVIVGSDGS